MRSIRSSTRAPPRVSASSGGPASASAGNSRGTRSSTPIARRARATRTSRPRCSPRISAAVPQFVLGLHAGLVADRFDRRRVMIVGEITRGLLVLGLVAVRAAQDVPWLYALAIAQAAVGVFFEPGRAAFVPGIVPPDL